MKRLRATLARQVPNLSRDTVRADRDRICRLDPTLVTSDVHQFMSLLHTAARLPPKEAEAPHSDWLGSITSRDSPSWVFHKEILRAEPTLEDVVRRLRRCYARLGDLSSLMERTGTCGKRCAKHTPTLADQSRTPQTTNRSRRLSPTFRRFVRPWKTELHGAMLLGPVTTVQGKGGRDAHDGGEDPLMSTTVRTTQRQYGVMFGSPLPCSSL